MIHLTKLAVGIGGVDHLRQVQAERRLARPLRHQTRNTPRRADEVTDGGSLYWVIAGAMLVRQRVLDIIEDHWDDGSACCGLVLDPALVPVEAVPVRPFQGWRYLLPEAAPADLADDDPTAGDLPPQLRRDLRSLCLI